MALIKRTPLVALRAGAQIWRVIRALAKPQARSLILMYHDIGFRISPRLFKSQMEFLGAHARVVPLETLLEGAGTCAAPGISCAITFDDGYEGVYRHAFPLLRELGFSSTIYLSTSFIRDGGVPAIDPGRYGLIEGRPLLSWRQVREMDRAGVRFGSHLCEHGDLSVLASDEAIAQLCRSKDEIATRLGKPCDHFAYPFGRLGANSAQWVRDAGYRSAVTTVHRPLASGEDPFRLPRIGIEDRYSLRDFVSIVRGDWDYIGMLQALRRPGLRMRRKAFGDPRACPSSR
jgi:peptidoglycan/xylan/chitin deacetylase (PgdA/CDA1 family)